MCAVDDNVSGEDSYADGGADKLLQVVLCLTHSPERQKGSGAGSV